MRQDAKERNKWLMVTIHDYTEFACQVLNRDLWSEQTVKAVVKAEFLFMQVIEKKKDFFLMTIITRNFISLAIVTITLDPVMTILLSYYVLAN